MMGELKRKLRAFASTESGISTLFQHPAKALLDLL
jgi:hypothetical protein